MTLRSDLRAIRRIWPLLEVPRGRAALAVLCGAAALGAAVGLAATSAWLIARASQMPSVLDLTVAVVAVRALGIGRGVARYLDRLVSHDVALRGAATLRERLYAALATGRADALAPLRRGEVLRRWGTDVDDVGELVVRSAVPTAVAGVVSLGSVALVATFSPAIAATLALALVLAGVSAPWFAARAVRRAELDAAAARGAVAQASLTVLDGAAELSVSGRLGPALSRLATAESALQGARDRAARPTALADAVTVLATGAAVVAAVLIGAAEVAAGSLAPVELAVVVLTPLAAFEGVGMLAPAAVHAVRAADAARRLTDLLRRVEAPACGGARPGAEPVVRARGLSIGWPGRAPLAAGIDLELAPGRAVAVIGPNGSGKSTLLATLAGLLPPAAGSVTIGGVPSADLADGAAAAVIALTGEDAHVFDTTLLENLRVARGDISEVEARSAVERAGLGALLERLPHGLATVVGSSGALISGGERRRLLLARALCSDAPLLLLDEPDEHLDPETADRVLRETLALTGHGRGVLVVTHRRCDALDAADQVIDLRESVPASA